MRKNQKYIKGSNDQSETIINKENHDAPHSTNTANKGAADLQRIQSMRKHLVMSFTVQKKQQINLCFTCLSSSQFTGETWRLLLCLVSPLTTV